jgi:hypothetical protein
MSDEKAEKPDRDKGSQDEVDHEENTLVGGWWQPPDGGAPRPEKRKHERVGYKARVQLVPPDGKIYPCESIDLGAGGVFLRLTDPKLKVPTMGQFVEVEFPDEGATFDGEVIRHGEVEQKSFAVRFVNLDHKLRQVLRKMIGEARKDTPETSYVITQKGGRPD